MKAGIKLRMHAEYLKNCMPGGIFAQVVPGEARFYPPLGQPQRAIGRSPAHIVEFVLCVSSLVKARQAIQSQVDIKVDFAV